MSSKKQARKTSGSDASLTSPPIPRRTSSPLLAEAPPAVHEPAPLPIRQPSLEVSNRISSKKSSGAYAARRSTTSTAKSAAMAAANVVAAKDSPRQQQKAQPSSFVSGVSESDLIPPDLERQQQRAPGAFAQPGLQEERQRPQQQRLEQQQPYMVSARVVSDDHNEDMEERLRAEFQRQTQEIERQAKENILNAAVHAEVVSQDPETTTQYTVPPTIMSGNHNESNNQKGGSRKKCWLWTIVLAILVLGGTGAGVAVALTGGEPDSTSKDPAEAPTGNNNSDGTQPNDGSETTLPTTSPTASLPLNPGSTWAPTQAPVPQPPASNDEQELLDLLTPISGAPLTTTGTPQQKAFAWLRDTPGIPLNFPEHIVELYAVTLFYFAMGGDTTWDRQYNFLSTTDPCDWNNGGSSQGVYCSSRGTVAALNIDTNGLQGSLPSELSVLTQLESLLLPGNRIRGTIPSELGVLSRLQYFQLYQNELEGSLPSEVAVLPNLIFLELWENSLAGSIPNFSSASSSLQVIDLDDNEGLGGNFTTILESAPSNLEEFWCSYCILSGSLSAVDWTRFPNFRSLYLEEAGVGGSIPASLASRPNLEFLNLGFNELTGSIPAALGQRSALQEVVAYSNFLVGTVPSFVSATNLYYLDLDDNELEGRLSTVLSRLPESSLEHLWLGTNYLSGSIPPTISSFSKLNMLVLYNLGLTGTIPSELATLSSLTTLSLDFNFLEGTVPRELAALPNLLYFTLDDNDLNDNLDNGFCGASSQKFVEFSADCGDSSPEVTCGCCTLCWSDTMQDFVS